MPGVSKSCKNNLGRSLLSLLVAASIAIFPIAGATAIGFEANGMHEAAASVMPTDDMECCPRASDPVRKHDDCGCMAACALICFSIVDLLSAEIAFPSPTGTLSPRFATASWRSLGDAPPFRPPRT